MDIVNPQVEEYMRTLQARYDEPVLLEMEREIESLKRERSSVGPLSVPRADS